METEYLTRAESADYLTSRGFPVSKTTMQKWATTGGGPIYRIFGNRALYTPTDLNAWAQEKLSAPRRSSTETGEARR